MVEITLFEQLEYLVGTIVSTPLILFLLFLLILIVSLLIAYSRKKIDITKKAIIGTILLSLTIIFFMYHTSLLKLLDGFIENLIRIIYFPNIVIYTIILLVSNYLMINAIITRKSKLISLPIYINTITIDFIALIFFQEISKGTIDIYQEIGLNSDKELLIILQLTTEIFVLYLLLNIFIYVIISLINLKNKNLKLNTKKIEIIDFDTLEKENN